MRETRLQARTGPRLPRRRTLCGAAVALTALVAAASPAATAGPAAAAPPPACPGQNLRTTWDGSGTARQGRPSGEQETAVVRVTNDGDRPCVLDGHPDVTLRAGGQDTESLRPDGRTGRPVTLAPGGAAYFEVVFLSETADPAQAITPADMRVRLPGRGTGPETTLPWPWGPVTRQEAATHPGNYTGPVTAEGPGPRPAAADRGAPPRPVDCGQGPYGLETLAVTRHGTHACPTATEVARALGKALDADREPPLTLRAADREWRCTERQGTPDPHLECVNTRDRAEKVLLVS
ncbi:DUF4232 domain-containing protein [Streptomyces sp. NPDC012888]|uniref:DUF4232 domain-containing protein n=1 Tax=Streptomyces sp. NPDC012888 TaxID=3364855 RepID=UPI0036C205CB